jgi:hypothetical protein
MPNIPSASAPKPERRTSCAWKDGSTLIVRIYLSRMGKAILNDRIEVSMNGVAGNETWVCWCIVGHSEVIAYPIRGASQTARSLSGSTQRLANGFSWILCQIANRRFNLSRPQSNAFPELGKGAHPGAARTGRRRSGTENGLLSCMRLAACHGRPNSSNPTLRENLWSKLSTYRFFAEDRTEF